MSYIGNDKIRKIYIGNESVKKVYLGTDIVFSRSVNLFNADRPIMITEGVRPIDYLDTDYVFNGVRFSGTLTGMVYPGTVTDVSATGMHVTMTRSVTGFGYPLPQTAGVQYYFSATWDTGDKRIYYMWTDGSTMTAEVTWLTEGVPTSQTSLNHIALPVSSRAGYMVLAFGDSHALGDGVTYSNISLTTD